MIPYYTLHDISLGPLTLNVWGIMAALAFAVALIIALRESKRKDIPEEHILDLAVLILAGGVIGARLAFVIQNWRYFADDLSLIYKLNTGGLMYYGGFIGALIAGGYYIRAKKISFLKIADTVAPSLAIGEFIGRIGCALADLHIGTITALPWGQKYIDDSVRHPIGLYMALNGLLMFIALWILRAKIKIEGGLFLFFLLWYSGFRFFLDFLRCGDLEECDSHYYGFTLAQYISIGIFFAVLISLILIIRRLADKKNMAEQQKGFESESKKPAASGEGVPSSTVSFTAVEEVIIESDNSQEDASADNDRKGWKNIFAGGKKKYWALILVLAIGFTAGAGISSSYYEKFFKKDLFAFRGKTWVAYETPIIKLSIVNDKNCKECSTEDIEKQLKGKVIPTLTIEQIDYNSSSGKGFISKFGIKALPALVFDSNIEKADIFQQASNALVKKDDHYYLNPLTSGLKPGKFLELPKVTAEDRVKGPENAPITMIEFSDFQCPYCKTASDTVKEVLAQYPDKIKFVYKNLPLPIHENAQYAAEAAECAGDQGMFFEMGDLLFANQAKLDKASIQNYSWKLKLNNKKFNECLDSGKFKGKISADAKVAEEYSISGTPAFFVNDQFVGGVLSLEQFKVMIDGMLKK